MWSREECEWAGLRVQSGFEIRGLLEKTGLAMSGARSCLYCPAWSLGGLRLNIIASLKLVSPKKKGTSMETVGIRGRST